jgi:hypothetical protein
MVQLKNQNTHKMAPRGEEENGAILAGTLKKSCAIYVACVKDPIEEKLAPKLRILDDQLTLK